MRKSHYIPNPKKLTVKKLTIRQQAKRLKKAYPDAKISPEPPKFNQPLRCELSIQPTPFSQKYLVEIILNRKKSSIDINVLDPALEKRGDEPIPHTYSENRLCLYRPRKKEWKLERPLETSIIPWVSLWLFYYEEWHRTGEWHGGGEH